MLAAQSCPGFPKGGKPELQTTANMVSFHSGAEMMASAAPGDQHLQVLASAAA